MFNIIPHKIFHVKIIYIYIYTCIYIHIYIYIYIPEPSICFLDTIKSTNCAAIFSIRTTAAEDESTVTSTGLILLEAVLIAPS
jgi:hypothetical protein